MALRGHRGFEQARFSHMWPEFLAQSIESEANHFVEPHSLSSRYLLEP